MVVSCSPSRKLLRSFAIAVAALALASLPITARAQDDTHGAVSSSDDNKSFLSGEDIDGASLAAAPNPSPKPQYGQTNSQYPAYESKWSKIAFEGGRRIQRAGERCNHLFNLWLEPDAWRGMEL